MKLVIFGFLLIMKCNSLSIPDIDLCPMYDCLADTSCPNGFAFDGNGCSTCQCQPSDVVGCAAIKCNEGFECKEIFSGCENAPPYQPCDQALTYGCVPKIEPCPIFDCLSFTYCPNGFATDPNGCLTCECSPSLTGCAAITCLYGSECKEVLSGCENPPPDQPCDPVVTYNCVPKIEPCPIYDCLPDIFCPNGYATDSNGCTTCDCLPSLIGTECAALKCVHGSECKKVISGCEYPPPGQPCDPIVTYKCVPSCPRLMCPECAAGNIIDQNGCRTCACSDPCQRVLCPDGQICIKSSTELMGFKCEIEIQLCPIFDCLPDTFCPNGFVTDSNGCVTCECLPSSTGCAAVTCLYGSECKEVLSGCENPPPGQPCDPILTYECVPSCPRLLCPECAAGNIIDQNGCRTCACSDPCQSVSCPDGQICTKSSDELIGYKCEIVCLQLKCRECASGNQKDINGCRTCACLDPCEGVSCPTGQTCVQSSEGYKCETPIPTCLCPAPKELYRPKSCAKVCIFACMRGSRCCQDNFGCMSCQPCLY